MQSLIFFLLVVSSSIAKVVLSEEIIKNNDKSSKDTEISGKNFIELPTYKPPMNMNETMTSKCVGSNFIDGELDCVSPIETAKETIDNGTALILTPFIENGKIANARKACRVATKLFLGVESYSGFFTVNKTYDSNIFFWYFPVENKPVNETPWLIWLQGGPGASSLTGLFEEIGPIRINKFGAIKRNPFSWTKNHSILFIDNPVGTGYSFTNHKNGFVSDMETYSEHLYCTVEQFLQVFPELRTAPLYIAGESYAGKYVPSLGIKLHRAKSDKALEVNLQGFIIGNAYVEPSMIRNVDRQFYSFGLLNKEQLQAVEPLIKSFQADIDANNSTAAKNKWLQVVTVLLILSHQKQAYNFLKDDLTLGGYLRILQSSDIKRALHVGDIKFSFLNVTVNSKMAPDFLSSSKSMFQELLDNYRVLSYCGQLDQLLPCISAEESLRTWQWQGRQQFIDAKRYPLVFKNTLFGYYKSGGNLTEAVIRGAGHMVPVDEPEKAEAFITNWIQRKLFATPYTIVELLYLHSILKNNTSF